MAYLVGYQADIYVTSGEAVPFAEAPTTSNLEGTIYTIDDIGEVAIRFLDRETLIVVEKETESWEVIEPADYTVNYAGGQIVFKEALPGETIRVSGGYLASSKLAQAHEWTLEYQRAQQDVTAFGDEWDTYAPVTGNGRLSVTRWWYDEFFIDELSTLLGFKLMPDSAGTAAFYAFGRLTGNTTNMRVKEILSENPSFQVHGNIAYIEEPA